MLHLWCNSFIMDIYVFNQPFPDFELLSVLRGYSREHVLVKILLEVTNNRRLLSLCAVVRYIAVI
jgi:hypothetical protein